MYVKKQKDCNLVLPGCGTLYYYYVGMLEWLTENNFIIKNRAFVSGGNFVGIQNAQGKSERDIRQQLASVNLASLKDFDLNPFDDNNSGLLRGNKILEVMRQIFPPSFRSLTRLQVITTNLTRYSACVWDNNCLEEVAQVVRASMAIPGVFEHVELNGDIHVDGGCSMNRPLRLFGNTDETISLRIFSVDEQPDPKKSYLGALFSLLPAMNERVDIERCPLANNITLKSEFSNLRFDFTKEEIAKMYKDGYMALEMYFQKKK